MTIVEIILLALSLSVDTIAVSLAGSVTLGRISPWSVIKVSAVFGLIQAGLIFLGWFLGASVAPLIYKVAHIVGFLILLYIGGSMIWGAFRQEEEKVNLGSLGSLCLAGLATSIDALAVGVSLAMGGMEANPAYGLTVTVFGVTFLAASFGVTCGSFIGRKFGTVAKVIGGCVLVGIGIGLLF